MLRQPDDRERWLAAHAQVTRTLDRFLRVLLGIVAVATFAGGAFLLVTMSSTSEGLGARLIVAVATVLLLGWVDGQFGPLAERRRPLEMSGLGESKYRQYLVRSGVLLMLSTLVLVGLALLLP